MLVERKICSLHGFTKWVIQDEYGKSQRTETFFDSSEYEIIRQLVLGRNTNCVAIQMKPRL